jgi:hypothetical protein
MYYSAIPSSQQSVFLLERMISSTGRFCGFVGGLEREQSFLNTTPEPVPHSLSVTFENSQSGNFPTNYDYSLLVLIISNYHFEKGVPADNVFFFFYRFSRCGIFGLWDH